MKLVLCSEGFHTQNTVQSCVDLVGKPQNEITFAVINEAFAVLEGDKKWVLSNLTDVAANFPAELDIVNLLALPLEEVEERIMQKDAIFVIGGHSDYLMSVFVKTGFDTLLPKLLETKVYVGSSAGSMIMGKRLSAESYEKIYEEQGEYDVSGYLGLVDFSIMPHLDSPHYTHRKEILLEVAKDYRGVIYGLRDDSAVIVNGDDITTTGSQPVILNMN